MGREIKRVALDFDWPLSKVWDGFLNPHYAGHCANCAACEGSGLSPQAKRLQDLWYGYLPFHPGITGSEPFSEMHPIVRARAEHAIRTSPSYYGSGDSAIVREAVRLAELFNASWSHHLDWQDVAALLKKGRLMDFTRVPRTPEQVEIVRKKIADGGNSWLPKDSGYVPTPQEVNDWSINGFGHDAINCWVVVRAKCKRLKLPEKCASCSGEGCIWDSPENKRIAEEWQRPEPPAGEGWQVWETVSDGSPVTPVFATPEELTEHLATKGDAWDQKRGDPGWGFEAAKAFVASGWACSMLGKTTAEGTTTFFQAKDVALEMSKK